MNTKRKRRILIIEPYFDGSHRDFLKGLQESIEAEFVLLTLPGRKWKMRMQLSAPWFYERVAGLAKELQFFDTVLCSTFVDVAVLRALLIQLPGWNPTARFCTYFHENQFAYPRQAGDPSIRQFSAINFMTAVASDSIAFNSGYNRDTFLEASYGYVKKASDMSLKQTHAKVAAKSVILHPGMDFADIDEAVSAPDERESGPPVIVWNHRWEYDKNPQEFFVALNELDGAGVDFRLIVLGQSFMRKPKCFEDASQQFTDKIVQFGFAESRRDYAAYLAMGDVVVSTAIHEFFGLSVLEAVRAGCTPLLPARLSYPELFSAKYLYGEGQLAARLGKTVRLAHRLDRAEALKLTEKYSWHSLHSTYENWLFGNSLPS